MWSESMVNFPNTNAESGRGPRDGPIQICARTRTFPAEGARKGRPHETAC